MFEAAMQQMMRYRNGGCRVSLATAHRTSPCLASHVMTYEVVMMYSGSSSGTAPLLV